MSDTQIPETVATLSRTCATCKAEAAPAHRFCATCGAALPSPSENGGDHVERRRIGGTRWAAPVESPADRPAPAIATPGRGQERHETRRRKRRKRAWRHRPAVLLPLLLLLTLGAAAGVMAYQASTTFNEIARVSTPPAYVEDSTVGGEDMAGMRFDTGPAVRALQEAGIADDAAGGGVFGSFRNAAGDVTDLAAGAAVAAGVKDPSTDALTILILGVDARPGAPIDIGVRPDAIMLLHLNPTAGTCRGLAIPRDALVPLPGYGESKINHALMLAGIPYQKLVVSRFLGVPIDRYALVDFEGFKELVDAVEGVPVTVPTEIKRGDDVLFAAGPQTFDGDQALAYARYRGEGDLDVGRIRRQQQIIRGLVEVAAGRNIATDVRALLPAVEQHIRTDLSAQELVTLADHYRTSCSEGNLELDTLQGSLFRATFPDPIFSQPLAYVAIDDAVLREKVAYLVE